jgi:hypothetical protein
MRIFLAAVAAALALTAQAQAATGLVGNWRLNEGSGTSAADSSGFADTGSVSGGFEWIAGKRQGALRLDGATGNVRVPVASVLQPATGVTVSAWVRHAGSPGNFRYVVAKGATGCLAASYGLYTGPDGGLEFYVSDQAGFSYTRSPDAGTSVWDGQWHLATGTFDGAVVRMYVDGVEVGSGMPRLGGIGYGLSDTDDLLVGRYAGCGGLEYGGDVDEVRIYGRALTADEVKAEGFYAFQGFFSPVNNPPIVNVAKAGSAVPVKFSLTGYQGMDIMAPGSPSSGKVACGTSAPTDALEETVTAGNSSLSYDATSDRYSYVWKTDKAWSGTCRQLNVALDDGSVHTALFNFTR